MQSGKEADIAAAPSPKNRACKLSLHTAQALISPVSREPVVFAVATTFTLLEVADVHLLPRCRAAPVAQDHSFINGTSCLHYVPLLRDSAPLVEVCPVSRGVILPGDSTPIRPITGRLSLSPRSHTRSPLGSPCGSLSRQCYEDCREGYGLTTFRVNTSVG